MDGSEEGNGVPREGDDVLGEVLRRLQGFGAAGDGGSTGEAAGKGSPQRGPAGANGNGAPHKQKRHPEDPPDAVPDAGQEVADPEQIRIKAARLGMAGQVIDPEYFEWLTRPLYRAVHEVRIGAVVMPGQQEAGKQLRISAATEAEMKRIRAGGKADRSKADWIEKNAVPRAEEELKAAGDEVGAARTNLEDRRKRVEELQEADEREGPVEGTTRILRRSNQRRTLEGRGGLFGRISISPGKAGAIFGGEVVATALVLTTKVADVFQAPLELAIPIAVALSLAILVSSYVAAMAAAAIRIPGRVMGLILVAVYAAVLFKFIPGLNALRESSSEGVEAMTGATLAACFVAGFTGYVTATKEDGRELVEEQELKKKAGTPLRHALQDLEEAEDAYGRAQRREAAIEYSLSELWEEVERFRDSAERAEISALERRRTGVEADVEAATIEAVTATGVQQERAAAEWATLAALIAHEKARLEEPPEEDELLLRIRLESERSGWGRRPWSAMQLAALGALGGGGIVSLVLGVVPLGIGASASALLILLDRLGHDREAASIPEEKRQRTHIVSPASDEDKDYGFQPDRMKPKYRAGGPKSGQHQ